MAKRKPKPPPNPLLSKARRLPKAVPLSGVAPWHERLRRDRPDEWRKLWDFMTEWTSDTSPDGIRSGLPTASGLLEWFLTEPEAEGFASYLPEEVTFRRFCRRFGAINAKTH